MGERMVDAAILREDVIADGDMTVHPDGSASRERAAVVAWLRRRAEEQDAAARAADTEGQRRVKQAQARSTRSAADRIERGVHVGVTCG